jgi:hypothetical protein
MVAKWAGRKEFDASRTAHDPEQLQCGDAQAREPVGERQDEDDDQEWLGGWFTGWSEFASLNRTCDSR